MPTPRSYADKTDEALIGSIVEHPLRFNNDARAYTPNAGETDGEGMHGNLAAKSVCDNPFKSARFYAHDCGWIWTPEEIVAAYPNGYEPNVRVAESLERRLELELQMPTLQPQCHPTYDGPKQGSPRAEEFQAKARAAHRAAGDYNRHAVQSGSVY